MNNSASWVSADCVACSPHQMEKSSKVFGCAVGSRLVEVAFDYSSFLAYDSVQIPNISGLEGLFRSFLKVWIFSTRNE